MHDGPPETATGTGTSSRTRSLTSLDKIVSAARARGQTHTMDLAAQRQDNMIQVNDVIQSTPHSPGVRFCAS
jgi:hypothetical protein